MFFLTFDKPPPGHITPRRLLLVDIQEMERKVSACDNVELSLRLLPSGQVQIQPKGQSASLTLARAGQLVSLQMLRHLNLTNVQRLRYFSDYLNGTLRTDMCPVNLVLIQGQLRYHLMTQGTTPRELASSQTGREGGGGGGRAMTRGQADDWRAGFLRLGELA